MQVNPLPDFNSNISVSYEIASRKEKIKIASAVKQEIQDKIKVPSFPAELRGISTDAGDDVYICITLSPSSEREKVIKFMEENNILVQVGQNQYQYKQVPIRFDNGIAKGV